MMNEDGRLERLETRVTELELEVQRLSATAYRAAPPVRTRPPVVVATAVAEPAAAPVPPLPQAPSKPPASFEGLIAGRGLQIAGALLVLVGCAFFLDLAFSRGWIGPAERILLGLVAGSALVGFGSRIAKPAYRAIGESLIGLGGGVLYLSLWASVQVFPDLNVPSAAAFAAMIAVTAALGALAATRRSQTTAASGALGGFLTPALLAGGSSDRVVLAAYILILSVAMLGLAARYAFGWVEVIALVGILAYAFSFAPDPDGGWSAGAAEIVASLFFIVFTVAISAGSVANVDVGRRVSLLAVATASYALVLEVIFSDAQATLGISLLLLSAALLGAAQIRPLDRAITRTYGYLALAAITLALAALLKGSTLLDALTIEAAVMFYAGRRAGDRWIPGAAVVLLAGLGFVEVMQGAVFDSRIGRELFISYAIWLASAGFVLFETRELQADAAKQNLVALGRIAFDFVAVFALSHACYDLFSDRGDAYTFGAMSSRGEFAISAVWTAYGSGLFLYGLRRKAALLRWEGLTLLGCTILKVFSVDLASVEIEWRVLSFIVLGGVLFAISALYTRSMNKAGSAAE